MTFEDFWNSVWQSIEQTFVPLPEPNLYQRLRDYYVQNGWEWQEVNLGAIRDTSKKKDNTYSDIIFAAYADTVRVFTCTTVYGTVWTEALRKKYGISYEADLCLGFYQAAYGIGNHRGYEALVQRGPMRCYIDKNLNNLRDGAEQIIQLPGSSGMNIHRSGADNATAVGASSAGCQVLNHAKDFYQLMGIAKGSEMFAAKRAWARWNYWLSSEIQNPFYHELRSLIAVQP